MKKRYKVTIAGVTLNLVSDEQEEYVNELVRLLDQRVSEMTVAGKNCSKGEAILFCAIDYFDNKLKSLRREEQMQETIDRLIEENRELRARLGMEDGADTAASAQAIAAEKAKPHGGAKA